jgi:predicted dehydrogenase
MINAAILGIGDWGRQLVRVVQGESEMIRFVAGATGRKERARAFAGETGIDLRNNLADLLSDDAIDAVVLATPHSQHAAQIRQVAAAGKAVLVEKPFTLTRASAEEAARACEAAGIVCALGHTRRFLPALVKLCEVVRGGALGQVIHVEGQFNTDEGYGLAAGHWRSSQAESPAGGMTGFGIHVMDALISFLGPIAQVTAMSERRVLRSNLNDTTVVLFRFEAGYSGYLATLTATAPFWRIHVFCSDGWIEMCGESRLVIKKRNEAEDVLDFPPLDPLHAELDAARAELEAFARAVSGGPPYPLPLDQAVHGTAVLEAIVTSSRTGETVSL